MQSIPFSEVRAHLADTLREVETAQEPLLISRRGETAGVLMSWSQYRQLSAARRGFGARLQQWRAECLPLSLPSDADADAAAPDADPFTNLRDPSPGRTLDWPV